MTYVLLIIGFILLIKGADYFVDGASSIAGALRIPTLIIGLTIVAFGTSAPELAVSITSALQGRNGIAVGNVVGSNLFNLLLVIGIAAMICPLKVQKSILVKDFPFTILASIALLVIGQDIMIQKIDHNFLSRADGVILLLLFGIFMYYLVEIALTSRQANEDELLDVMPLGKSIPLAIGGVVGIVMGGKIVVDAATTIAYAWGMSESLVGLTIIAVGTSLPELVTSIVAARKGQSDIALGNVIGSNVFNILLILGISSFIHPIEISGSVLFDMGIMLISTILVYVFAISKRTINKAEGSLLTLLYVAYMAFAIIRN